jgi:hypothetical protein
MTLVGAIIGSLVCGASGYAAGYMKGAAKWFDEIEDRQTVPIWDRSIDAPGSLRLARLCTCQTKKLSDQSHGGPTAKAGDVYSTAFNPASRKVRRGERHRYRLVVHGHKFGRLQSVP